MAPTLYDEKPNPGDLIEIFRGSYQHWAIYIGNGFVVHLAPPCVYLTAEAISKGFSPLAHSNCSLFRLYSAEEEKAIVKEEELWDVVGTNKWVINNSLDKKYTPRSTEVIIQEARRQVGQEIPYCVFRGNCEHFVNQLRYGQPESRQVRKAGETALFVGLAGAVGFGIVALAGAFFGGNKNEKEKNTQ